MEQMIMWGVGSITGVKYILNNVLIISFYCFKLSYFESLLKVIKVKKTFAELCYQTDEPEVTHSFEWESNPQLVVFVYYLLVKRYAAAPRRSRFLLINV